MDFVKAAEIATQFEKDYSKKYKLLEIKDNGSYDRFTCIYLNKITQCRSEVVFPFNALETCRMKSADDVLDFGDILIDGCHYCWVSDTKESDIVQGDFELLMQGLSDRVWEVARMNLDLSEVYDDEILELKNNVELLYKQLKECKEKNSGE